MAIDLLERVLNATAFILSSVLTTSLASVVLIPTELLGLANYSPLSKSMFSLSLRILIYLLLCGSTAESSCISKKLKKTTMLVKSSWDT